ncbi:hypothetical protein BOTCAL_0474g00050 [Botryotinia calthae]|uniref:Uncharacterized protein n=1 Tax=Botryotinia calthae TaxID=38488 RepID=A0A4Y8CPZ6_9HELO|nr:hypothetical protein BOTCAL_0474g00050 [Botryotinia calthae]
MAPKLVQDAHDTLVELSRQCSEAHQILYLNQDEEYPILLISKIQRGAASMQRAFATFHADLKSFAATTALKPTKNNDGGVKKQLATQVFPGLTLLNADGVSKNANSVDGGVKKSSTTQIVPGLTLAIADEALELVNSGDGGDKKPSTNQVGPGLTLINVDEIPEPIEPLVRDFYHENGRGFKTIIGCFVGRLHGTYLDPYLGIFLLACTENPRVRIEDQSEMKGQWLRFPWKSFCGNLPVILQFLNKNYRSMKEGGETLVYDTYTTATPKLSYRGVGFNFMLFMKSDFAKNQSGYHDVKYLTPYNAFKALKSLGFCLTQSGGGGEKMGFSEKQDLITMARFLGMSEELIEEKFGDKVVEDMSQHLASKNSSSKKMAQETSDFISFDDPINSGTEEGKEITIPSKRAPEERIAGMAKNFPYFKHLERKRKFEV